jgi:hypothetical protein
MITFTVEDFDTIPEIVANLAEDNYEESGLLQGKLELNVNEAAYGHNYTQVFAMREDGVLVGYAVFLVIDHPHFKGTTFAMNDVVYIKPEHRKESRLFFEYIDKHLSPMVNVINYSMNYANPHIEFMKSLGYEPTEVVYHKVVEHG